MLLPVSSNPRRLSAYVSIVLIIVASLFILHPSSRERISRWPSHSTPPASTISSPTTLLDVPADYGIVPPQPPGCAQRYSIQYLEYLRDHKVSYCAPDSRSNITCFHGHGRMDGAVDSMCIGRATAFDLATGKFSIDCTMRDLSMEEIDRGMIPFDKIRPYWYETGTPFVFKEGVEIQSGTKAAQAEPDRVKMRDDENAPSSSPPRNFLLVKREGELNPWHCLMEIFSTWMTFDVLRMSRDATRQYEPFFRVPEDVPDTQVVILDERGDGPFFDLWTLFATRHKPLRLKELAEDRAMVEAINDANIIVPLAGGSNPYWAADWVESRCNTCQTLSVFSSRVLNFYNISIEAIPFRSPDTPIAVTFIDRIEHRQLLNKTALFDEVKRSNPHITVRMIDFATITFEEQLRVVRSTDVLIGVHGAGLTHTLFMSENIGAVVEIQPRTLDHAGFRDISAMRGLGYFRVHADSVEEAEGDRDHWRGTSPDSSVENESRRRERQGLEKRSWHTMDIRIEPERFLDVVETAIKSVYSKGAWNYDVN